jgi:hypothetical protein
MANIKDLIKSIEAADSSFDEKLAAINQMEETLVSMRAQEEQAVQDNVDLIVEAIKVMERKVENQLEIAKSIVPEKGDKGDKGERGLDGANGRDGKDGRDGINGRDGQDGQDGVSVTDAKIDFDGSLVITLSTGQEINVGEVVAPELQEKIKLVTSGGAGTVLPSQTGNANKYLKTDGTGLSWDTLNGSDIDLSSPPTIGNTTPNTGTFTTLIGGGGSANYGQLTGGATTKAVEFKTLGSDTNIALVLDSKGTGAIDLAAGSSGVNISNGGTVTAITRTAGGTGYTVAPTITISAPTTVGGVQATATCTVTAGVVDTSFTITNAGSGYVEQPTITFTPVSGGSGAAAYATVGAATQIKTLFGSATTGLSFYTPVGEQVRIANIGDGTRPILIFGGAAGGSAIGGMFQPTSTAQLGLSTNTGSVSFFTGGQGSTEQMRVSHTASAVNYVQVTGSATTTAPTISSQGSDANIGFSLVTKGTFGAGFKNSLGSNIFTVNHSNTATQNYLNIASNTAGSAPSISSLGTDTDIDLTLTPKGAGNVRFGAYTASVLTPTGYITIKDSGGTTRRLLVG